jgi:AcrR family transcriptional regulator
MTNITTKKRGPYAKSAATRERAVEAAIEIFSTSGFRGATLTDVAEKLGMSLTGLQHHFPDKDSLLSAVLAERDRRSHIAVPIPGTGDATERFISIVVRNQQTPALTELHTVLSAESTSADHPAHDYFVERYEREREGGRRYFQGLIDRGELEAAADAKSLSSLLIAVADGLQLQWLLDPNSVDMRAELRRFLTVGLPAMAANPVPPPGDGAPDD